MSIKYIFVTGGVVSGLGKGITAASLGRLLKERGYKVTVQKFDPYINVDPGTMSPYQHGEVFVTDDGAETDLDIGHYERFVDENLSINSNITSGKVYWTVINKERSGEYNGGTVQVIPHITNEIKDRVYRVGKDSDIVITEIGGTVGDIESQPFMEAIRQVVTEVGRDNAMYIHVTLVPTVPGSTELKSKPTQHSVKSLLSLGIHPNVIVCRADHEIPDDMRDKIALFCSIRKEDIIQNTTVASLYEAPLMLEEEGLAHSVCYHLNLENSQTPPMVEWRQMIGSIKSATKNVTIGLVGKYTELPDAYISVIEALEHGGIPNSAKIQVKLINSEGVTAENVDRMLAPYDAVIVPSGFGQRGLEGKILAVKYARENKVPFLGIGLGMHMVATELARHILGYIDADSVEFSPDTKHPVSVLMDEIDEKDMTRTMRLGLAQCDIIKGSLLETIYNSDSLSERHRHRYQLNKDLVPALEGVGLTVTSTSTVGGIVEAVEIKDHPWFLAVQFHPEFKSRPNKPHPIFAEFIKQALKNK